MQRGTSGQIKYDSLKCRFFDGPRLLVLEEFLNSETHF